MDAIEFPVSLSKGIFVHKKAGMKKKIGQKNSYDKSSHQQFRVLSQRMEEQIKAIEEEAYKETFYNIVKFINSSFSSGLSDNNEISTAILVMGVNMPDHSNIFHLLEQEIHSNDVIATAVLQSKDCHNFSSLLQKLIPCIFTKYQKHFALEDFSLKKTECTFSKLLTYYNDLPKPKQVTTTPKKSPRKRSVAKANHHSCGPVVILVQDVESFNPDILKELVMNCSLYAGKLPIVLVFGMASAMVTLHNILPQNALCCLDIETFYSLTAIEYLTRIVQEVVLSPENPFKLGPKTFRLLIDTVLYHDFSIKNLMFMLKFCMAEHFYNNDIAVACCDLSSLKKSLQQIGGGTLEKFKKIPSFSRFLENNPKCRTALKSDKDFRALLWELLQKYHTYHNVMITLLHCLHIFVKDLPGYPMGKHVREIYPLALESPITTLESYQEAAKLLKMHSKDDLEIKLKSCIEILSESCDKMSNPCLTEICEILQAQLQKLEDISEGDCKKEAVVNIEPNDKITSRSQLQEKLKLRLLARRSKFDGFKENFVDVLTEIFKNVQPPSHSPFYEVLYFDNVVAVKQHLMAVPRVTLHRNLVNPQTRLKCSCCKIDSSEDIISSMPDLSILYKLHLECGKLINLYDWLQAFKAILDEKSNKISDVGEHEKQLNTRFLHAVSELQLLGFIKPTKRKTDHVARLTFGNF